MGTDSSETGTNDITEILNIDDGKIGMALVHPTVVNELNEAEIFVAHRVEADGVILLAFEALLSRTARSGTGDRNGTVIQLRRKASKARSDGKVPVFFRDVENEDGTEGTGVVAWITQVVGTVVLVAEDAVAELR